MKKRILILVAALVIVGVAVAVLIPKAPKTKPEEETLQNDFRIEPIDPAEEEKTDPSGKEKPSETEEPGTTEEEEPLPESGTAYIDKDVSVTIGVAEGDGNWEEEEPEPSHSGGQSSSSEEPTEPDQPEQPEQPGQGGETPSDPPVTPEGKTLKYEEFYALSPEQKDAYLNSFADYGAFYEWLIVAQQQFTKDHPDIEIGPNGSIDLTKLLK